VKRLKLHQLFDGAARTFSDPQAWVWEGEQEFENFSKQAIFLVLREVKPYFSTFGLP